MSSPQRRDALTHGERLLIRSVRLLAIQGGCEGLKGCFEAACGASGAETYRTLQAFVQQLRVWSRRTLELAPPGDPAITAHEAAILDVFGLAQSDDFRAMRERLAALVGAEPPMSLGAAAAWVGRAFEANGLTLTISIDPIEESAWLPLAAE